MFDNHENLTPIRMSPGVAEEWRSAWPRPGFIGRAVGRQFSRWRGERKPKAPKSLKERLDAVAASYLKEKAQ